MPLDLTWQDTALRLALTLVAGALIGFNREAHGHAAGLRTMMLVCLAASASMVLANLLLSTSGKTPDSFAQIDVMRLPLGVLTGVGFHRRRRHLPSRRSRDRRHDRRHALDGHDHRSLLRVQARSRLGAAATALSLLIIWALKWVDGHIARDQVVILSVTAEGAMPSVSDVRQLIDARDCRVQLQGQTQSRVTGGSVSRYHIRWRGLHRDEPPLRISVLLDRWPEVSRAEWETEVLN